MFIYKYMLHVDISNIILASFILLRKRTNRVSFIAEILAGSSGVGWQKKGGGRIIWGRAHMVKFSVVHYATFKPNCATCHNEVQIIN